MARILVVDDARSICKALATMLSGARHTVLTATSGASALSLLAEQEVELMLCDVKMPGMDGLAVMRQARALDSEVAVVMMSGHRDITVAVEAMKAGALDYLLKPLRKEDVLRAVHEALAMRTVLVDNLVRKQQAREQFALLRVIGSSPAWRSVCQMVKQAAPSQATVLLTGESGTGKELMASLLHRLSPRTAQPFIVLNAAAMPATLLEAELFGYEKGAFTGALQRKPGHFELADGGTLFLDEIGDMPLEVQAKLLRVLQDGTFKRLGGTRTLHADVRVLAATNKDLLQEVADGRFRQELYYRLNVIAIPLPPLRERRSDIPLLVAHFVRQYAQNNRKEVNGLQQETLRRTQGNRQAAARRLAIGPATLYRKFKEYQIC
jgi:DNA-binding NtrC family response regulator